MGNDDDDHQDSTAATPKNIDPLDKYEAQIASLKKLLNNANETIERMNMKTKSDTNEIQALTTQVSQLTTSNDQLMEQLEQTNEILRQKEIQFAKALEEEKEKARLQEQVMENSS